MRTSTSAPSTGVLLLLAALCAPGCESKSGGGGGSGGTVLTDLEFETREDVDVGAAGLGQCIVQDLNGDGIQDLAVVSWLGLSIRVAMGEVDGSYQNLPELPVPSSPLVLAAGDVSGDGRIDLVAGCVDFGGTGLPSVTVYDQDSLGLYTQSYSFVLPTRPTSIALGAPDGGTAQIFVALEEERAVWQLGVDAPHSLSFVASYDTLALGGGAPVTVALVDVTGQGTPDLVAGERAVSGGQPDRVVLFPNDLSGGFGTPVVVLPSVQWPIVQSLAADADAFQDLAVSQLEADEVVVLYGGPTGLSAPVSLDFRGKNLSAAFGDFDGNGLWDAAAALYEQGSIGVKLQTAPGVYDQPASFNATNGPRSLHAAVLPGDKRLDLVCSGFGAISILRGKKHASFVAMRGFLVGDRPQYVLCADFDDDGHPDTCSVDQFQQDVVFQRGLGQGLFEYVAAVPLSPTSQETPGYLIVGDFDEDGLPDVLASVLEDAAVQLMRNDGTLPLSSLRVDRTPVGNEPLGLSSGNLNEDAHLDAVVANSVDHTMQVLFGNGDGTFVQQLPIPVGDQSLTVQCADLDGDEFTDVALCTGQFDGSNAKLSLWRGDGQGHLALAEQQALEAVALVMSCGDFNLDGLCDLALSQADYVPDSVFVLINEGDFQFTSNRIQVGHNPGTLVVADVDNDGIDDLICPLGTGSLRMLLGDGFGGFQTTYPDFAVDLPSPFAVNASAWCDVDGNHLPDLLLVSPESPYMWISLNKSR